MNILHKNVIIIGGGPAGLAAAIRLKEQGINDILILERERFPGGILRQCIHDGFGLTRFGQSLSGPEYAGIFLDKAAELKIEIKTETTVINLTENREITAVCREGLLLYQADAVILTMGCRERTRGALSIPGERPAGIFTAGVAQNYINLQNKMVGREIVILGSGDIGMIMARRLTLEGAHVKAVFEVLPYPSGLPRNVEQCLHDYDIPLYLRHTVTDIRGHNRLEAVIVSEVDEEGKVIPGTQQEYSCDTLILSVGLIPENELSALADIDLDSRTRGASVDEFSQTTVPGIFAAGNVLHVHDLVDFVSLEAERMADAVNRYLREGLPASMISLETDGSVGYTVPQRISGTEDVRLSFRPRKPVRDCHVNLVQDGQTICTHAFARLIPAQMTQITLPKEALRSRHPIKVVLTDD